ncbi:hypothetical protein D3C77_599080 [compost metagenome]
MVEAGLTDTSALYVVAWPGPFRGMAASDRARDSSLWCLSAFCTVRGRASPAAVAGAYSGSPRNSSTPPSVSGRSRLFIVECPLAGK